MSTSSAQPSTGERTLSRLPQDLEATLFEVWLGDDRAAAERTLAELCRRAPQHAEELRRVAAELDFASHRCDDVGQQVDSAVHAATGGDPLPQRVSRYRVVRELGRGGFGAVFLAEQSEPIARTVALKVLLPGMRSERVLQRFELERQTLAQMDHPNIADILDAGTGDEGEPYVVMEFVPGVPITRFCDQHALTVEQRLRLFLAVCAAVQHAHQKGVLHRDLKPGNVLVRDHDGTPLPKVIDFGLAKALAPEPGRGSAMTEEGRFVGTIEYMSPEQAAGEPVDTRADIYALGVLLYELLTGELPLDSVTLRGAGWSTAVRILREREPQRPSEMLAARPDALRVAAVRRRVRGDELLHRLRGDLNWIVMTALAKDPERRYASAADLAADVRRHLEDRPVLVGPPSLGYTLRKFARRHRPWVIAGAAVLVMAMVGAVAAAWAAVEIVRERDHAQRNAYAAEIAAAAAAMETDDASRMSHALGRAPADLRQWEWRFLAANCDHSTARIATGHRSIGRMALVGGGAAAVISNYSDAVNYVDLWDLRAADRRYRVAVPDEVFSVRLSPDGETFALGLSDGSVQLRRLADGRLLQTMTAGRVHASIDFAPDGRRLVAAAGDTLRLFEVPSGRALGDALVASVSGPIQDVCFLPDGRRVAIGEHSGDVQLWDVDAGRALLRLRTDLAPRTSLRTLALDRRGERVASASSDGVRVWRTEDGSPVLRLDANVAISDVAFAADGETLATATYDGRVMLWRMATGLRTETLRGHEAFVTAIDYSDDGGLVSAAWDGSLRTWRPGTAAPGRMLAASSPALSVAAHPRRNEILAATEDELFLLDLASGRPLWRVTGPRAHAVAFVGDDRFATLDRHGSLTLRRVDDGTRLASTTLARSAWVARMAADAGTDQIAASAGESGVAVVDAATLQPRGRVEAGGYVIALAFAGELVVAATEDAVHAWTSRDLVEAYRQPVSAPIRALAVTPDGSSVCVGTAEGTLLFFDARSGALERIFGQDRPPAMGGIRTMAFAPDGRRLATFTSDHAVRLRDCDSGTEFLSLTDHESWCFELAFSADGAWLLAAVDSLYGWHAPLDAADLLTR